MCRAIWCHPPAFPAGKGTHLGGRGTMFARMKDMAVAMAAKVYLTPYVEEFGEIESVEVDSESRRLTSYLR